MDDPEVVRRGKGLSNLPRDRKRIRKAQPLAFPPNLVRARLAGDQLRQRSAADQLHDNGSNRPQFLDAVNLCDMWMIERGEDVGFALEARHALGIQREGIGQDLESHVATQSGVGGAIHLAHAAGANGGEDLIRPEASAQGEGQTGCVWSIAAFERRTDSRRAG